jgi:hypothetical protein
MGPNSGWSMAITDAWWRLLTFIQYVGMGTLSGLEMISVASPRLNFASWFAIQGKNLIDNSSALQYELHCRLYARRFLYCFGSLTLMTMNSAVTDTNTNSNTAMDKVTVTDLYRYAVKVLGADSVKQWPSANRWNLSGWSSVPWLSSWSWWNHL